MNERIKELAIKAGFGTKWTEASEPGTPANINEMVVREFAEMIVQECVELVDISSECFTIEQVRIKQLAKIEILKLLE